MAAEVVFEATLYSSHFYFLNCIWSRCEKIGIPQFRPSAFVPGGVGVFPIPFVFHLLSHFLRTLNYLLKHMVLIFHTISAFGHKLSLKCLFQLPNILAKTLCFFFYVIPSDEVSVYR